MFWTLNADCAALLYNHVPFSDRRSLRATSKKVRNWIDDNNWILNGTPVKSLNDIKVCADDPVWIRFHLDQCQERIAEFDRHALYDHMDEECKRKSRPLDFREFQPGLTPSNGSCTPVYYYTRYYHLYTGTVGTDPIMALVDRIDYEQGRVVGWIEGRAYDPSACPMPWNYFYWPDKKRRATERVFARYTVLVDQSKPIVVYKRRSELHAPIRLNTDIYRLFYDARVVYYDYPVEHVFPVWIKDRLGLSETVQQSLLAQIDRLDADRNDIHPNGVVHDIVDPDLFPNPIKGEPPIVAHMKNYERLHQIAGEKFDRPFWMKTYIERENNPDFQDTGRIPKPDLRDKYQWIPSDVVVRRIESDHKTTYRSHFLSPIHGLNRPDDADLARNVQAVFQKMLPQFAKLHFFKQCATTKLQVVVKIQSYHIQPGQSYEGHWHTEGRTERCIAVGVYYAKIDQGLEGGALKFRMKECPSNHVERCDPEIMIQSEGAIVFTNTLPHRFRAIINRTKEVQQRTFINFFILDPTSPLPSTATLPDAWDRIPFKEATAHRRKVREQVMQNPTGWGIVDYGNEGMVRGFVYADETKIHTDILSA